MNSAMDSAPQNLTGYSDMIYPECQEDFIKLAPFVFIKIPEQASQISFL